MNVDINTQKRTNVDISLPTFSLSVAANSEISLVAVVFKPKLENTTDMFTIEFTVEKTPKSEIPKKRARITELRNAAPFTAIAAMTEKLAPVMNFRAKLIMIAYSS
ncbi:hypothetical protein KAR91_27300 [Candidatus Pacearchaeota archaeon]|nr:hypothetical protein [Candidatus Pacearchaeota archaeon]